MSDIRLSQLFELEDLEAGLYRGSSWDLGYPALYGGQVLGQSLMAAYQTVPKERVIHSLHSYFLLPGDAKKPVVYDVEDVRDGRSFSTRRVKAIQNGRNIFYMTASFQIEEDGFSHQHANMPQCPSPEEVMPDIEHFENQDFKISERVKQALSYHRPIDVRTVGDNHSFMAIKSKPERNLWLRGTDPHEGTLQMNQASLAYASDYNFLSTALQAHGLATQDRSLRMATIDHAMWFHKPFSFDEWLLYEMESPFSGNSRALVRGKIFDSSGKLVATSVQEGLIRQVSDKQ